MRYNFQLELRMENERYFRAHPEINGLLQLFISRILDDRPENVLEYAGTYFDSASLRDLVHNFMEQEKKTQGNAKYMSDLIKGKVLI